MCGWGGVFPEKYFGVKKHFLWRGKNLHFSPVSQWKIQIFSDCVKNLPIPCPQYDFLLLTLVCCFDGERKGKFLLLNIKEIYFYRSYFLTYTHTCAYLLYGFCLACCMFVYCMKNLWGVKILWDEKNFLIKFLLKISSDEFCIVENLAFVKNKIKRLFRKLINGRWICFGIFN